MEFGILRGIIDTKSYLDLDDVYGPGLQNYKKITKIPSCDFALYKISSYALCDIASDRRKFVSELPSTIEELGVNSIEYIEPLLQSIVLYL